MAKAPSKAEPTHFAAYDDVAVRAVGETPDAAIDEAARQTREPRDKFQAAPISFELAARIAKDGWNADMQDFRIDSDGSLVEVKD